MTMRLSNEHINIIKNTLSQSMNDFTVFLFGSRVDDSKRGGDIDLFVKTSQNISLQDELLILAKLEHHGIMRKIDLILDTPNKSKDKFFESIKNEMVRL